MSAAHDKWNANSVHYNPKNPGAYTLPGIYALYQNGLLKYIGQSEDCAARIRHWRRAADPYFKEARETKCDAWELGVAFTARVHPLPHLTGGRWSEDERRRKKVEDWWAYHLRPPCNRHIPATEPPRPVDLP